MDKTDWDIREVKYLKKKRLVKYNFVMLLLFVLLIYFAEIGRLALLFGVICVYLWIVVASMLYTLKTGISIGTKTSKYLQKFDRNHLGKKRWKRRKITETIISIVLTSLITVLLVVTDFNSFRLDYPIDTLPFIGAWVGYNIGEMIRIRKL